jgi:DNA-binding NtrC family response regulator
MEKGMAMGTTSKTILLVDDDEKLNRLISSILVDADYNVLAAANGADALRQSDNYQGEIFLLLSDFQMPGMSGIELATNVIIKRPAIEVLLMSGFPQGMLVLNGGWHFLPKPFIPSQLIDLILGLNPNTKLLSAQ